MLHRPGKARSTGASPRSAAFAVSGDDAPAFSLLAVSRVWQA
jgi:hypothetical protein